MEKIILTDADGCLVDWNTAFNIWMTERGYPQLPNTESDYSLVNRHGISLQQVQTFVKEFNEGPEIAKLFAFADSQEYIAKLVQHGFKFIVVTSISSNPDAHYFREKNLKNLFGNDTFEKIYCIETGASKDTILAENWLGTGYFWIEDHMRQAEAGHEAGLRTVLIDHPYNSHYTTDLFPRVSYETPWKEIYNMVCAEYNIESI